MSQLSAPLFTEDRYSTSTDNNEENCDAEITTITRQWMPSQTTTMVMSPTRPVSTPSMVDCSTQGDPDQMAPQGNHGYNQDNSTMPIQHTNNYLIPDGSDRHIHDIQDKKHFTEAYWKMDILLILWNFQTSNHYFTPADT